jgi:hypothetical protein
MPRLACVCLLQAMAAYRTANRLFPGLHMPLLGMGMEYQRMNNLHLAEQMFLQVRPRLPAQPQPCLRASASDGAQRWYGQSLSSPTLARMLAQLYTYIPACA